MTASPPASGKDPVLPPPSLLARLGFFLARRRRTAVLAGLILLIVSVLAGAGTPAKLTLSRYEAPGSESVQTRELLHEAFGAGSANLILVVTAKSGNVDHPEVREAGLALTRKLAAEEGIAEASSYWSQGESPALRSRDGSQALVTARLYGSATEVRTALAGLSPRYTLDHELLRVQVGGQEEVFRQVGEFARQDFLRAELIILPSVLLLLLLLYRRWSAALLTVGTGLFSMVLTLAALGVIVRFTEVSTFAMNLTLVMGLGLGIDYSLFIISRFREEWDAEQSIPHALARTLDTAGRTVIYSGATVAVSLLALLLFPFPFLRSLGYAGVLVVLSGMLGAVVFLPAALALLGGRVSRGPQQKRTAGSDTPSGFWYRTAMATMRRPGAAGGAALLVLLLLASPAAGLHFGLPDDRMLPASASSRVTQDAVRTGFEAEEADAIQVAALGTGRPAGRLAEIERYAAELSRVPGITQVDSWAGTYAGGVKIIERTASHERFASERGTWFAAIPSVAALAQNSDGLLQGIRAVPAPFEVRIGGFPAELADYRASLVERLPLVLSLILGATFVILFLMTGSLLLPLKATVLNLLSLSVMFGGLVWVFQDGHLSGLLRFTSIGTIEPSIPILMFCIAYGLSMDYEVFILSRIKEEYDRTGDNTRAVAAGIQRSAPLVSAAAGILALSFAAYASGSVVLLKMLGVGMALAVIVDATLIRALLVPALMRLAGEANWWAPQPLRRLYERFGLHEAGG
ncbi:MMPL family transporter [Paenibacillus mucilaginosus]|uniref:Predicted RND superfamily drug exporter n=1 Tax=Paenibacillus mucilaginosus (strain KNP414) TaxID=1036673 RepID=F8FIY4_PAEMK|nr:MMPL family transporter [Paenibacillus mucilaginosus]AEI46362.1 predicted RND superfamily drug exporter [Paenibacillus mucilaginosus KNP414]MCG7213525.1 MMPL family transporter [Paenibacillus mucilaginosus]WDM27659.1 MMPL family transporter [Paenibacillus mucilaginosus]